jgi:rubrerythrin
MADQASGKYRTTFGFETMIYTCKFCGFIFRHCPGQACPRCGEHEEKVISVKSGTFQSPDKSLDQGEVK